MKLKKEAKKLSQKIKSLSAAVDNGEFTVSQENLIFAQIGAMVAYMSILDERITRKKGSDNE